MERPRPSVPPGATATTRSGSVPRHDEVTLKLVCVGAAATGKTTFLKYWETSVPHAHVRTTIQMEFHKLEMAVTIPLDETAFSALPLATKSSASFSPPARTLSAPPAATNPSQYKLLPPDFPTCQGGEERRAIVKVWDIQGQDRTRTMTRPFYQGALGALVFCDIANQESLEQAILWKKDICSKIFVTRMDKSEENPPCWLVVNKHDMLKDITPLPLFFSRPSLDAFCLQNGFAGWCYASGLKGQNVHESIKALVATSIALFPHEIRNQTMAGTTATPGAVRTRKEKKKESGCCDR